jgi:prepilin signal peptidase PulO-like enzyme (type II secretory pathway)
MDRLLVIVALFFIYFHISGLATTNILRLTRGNTLPVLASKCVCGHCGTPITPFYQLPIISYTLCKGRCRNCKTKIPADALMLEICALIGMFLISAGMAFSFLGVTVSFLCYELLRVLVIVWKGKREQGFGKQYVIAVLAMIPFYLITLFVALIYKAVSL